MDTGKNTEVFQLHVKVLENDKLDFDQKKKMLNEIRKLMSADQNRWNFRYVIIPLAAVTLTVPIYAFTLVFKGQPVEIPDALLSLGSTALGAVAAFLTHYTEKRDTASSEGQPPPPTAP